MKYKKSRKKVTLTAHYTQNNSSINEGNYAMRERLITFLQQTQ